MENNIASILVETLLKTAGTDFTKLYIIIHTIETIERTIYQTIVQTIMSSNYGSDYSSNYTAQIWVDIIKVVPLSFY